MKPKSLPLVSVIMPVYNAEKYVGLAIDSILKQTFTDFEFLIFNDGSSDNSKQIIESFKDPRIKFYDSVSNSGYVAHLNRGIELATGKYIARMDADDISLPERFELQVNFLESHPDIGLCGAWILQFEGNDEPDKRVLYKYPADHDEICVTLLRHNSFAHPVVMMRRKILIEYGLRYDPEYMPSEDARLWVSIKKYTRLHNIQKVLLQYRKHNNQISTEKRVLRHRNTTRIKIELIERITGPLSEKEKAIYSDIIHKTYSNNSEYVSSFYALVNKIIAENNIKKIYPPKELNRQLQNILRTLSKKGIPKNEKVLLFWLKQYPEKKSFGYFTYMFYLLFQVRRLNTRVDFFPWLYQNGSDKQ